eukprot:maker-scaffold_2-snap-gene-13.41-mRNA-1 protein AED:0.40 eAED:0.42 QI:0/0/0/1/0/0/2/0/64
MVSLKISTEIDLDNIFGKVVACVEGYYHAAILTAKGRVYTFGCGHDGKLGHGDQMNKKKPTLLK